MTPYIFVDWMHHTTLTAPKCKTLVAINTDIGIPTLTEMLRWDENM